MKWLMVTDSYKIGYYPWTPNDIVEPDIKRAIHEHCRIHSIRYFPSPAEAEGLLVYVPVRTPIADKVQMAG